MKKFWDYFSGKSRTRSCTPGFSMMEILISCVIIGVLAVILIPTMQSAKPDKNEALHKKSTFVVERVINELSSDTQLYPNNGEYSSLSNTENVTYNNETHGGPTKFCTLFASRIKLKAGSEVSCIEGEKSFTSEDGIDWYLPVSDFKGGSETIMIDVNGSAGPNAIGEDRYEYKVQPGFKIPKKEIDEGAITNTPAAPVKEDPSAGVIPTGETKTSQAKYSINCNVLGGEASILGAGDNKVNGNYTLVAVPKAGYKCNWFTKQVTVKDGDVGNCDLSCEPDTLRPVQDGETNINEIPDEPLDFCVEHPDDPSCIPDHCEQHPDDPDCIPDYCASVNWSGSSEYCSDSGKVCGKPGTKYNITIKSSNKNYKAQFTQGQGSGTFGNSNVVLQASCNPSNKCYNMYLTGDSNCPYTTPEENCPYPNVPGYTNGTYNITVNAKDGYTFNGKEGTSTYQIKINGSNVTKDLTSLCKKSGSDKITINVTAEDMNSGTGWFSMSSSSEMPEAVSSTLTSNVEIWDDRWPNSSGQLVPEVNTATVTIAKGQTKSATQPAHTTVTGVDRFLNASAIVSMGGKTVSTSVSGPYEFSRNGVAYTVEYDIQGGSPPRKQCKVTMQNSSGGTTTPAGGTTTSVDCGFPLTITAKANSGYKFSTWEKVSGNGSFRNAKTASTMFTPTSDSTIKATFTGGTGKIKVTLKSDGSGCSHGTYMDIMKATVVARGNNKNYTINIGPSNPPMSGTVSVPAGNYVLTNTAFDPTLSCMAGDCSTYEEIKVLSLSPTNVTVPANGTAEATLLVGCNGIGNTCAINLIGDGGFGGQVNAEVKLSGGASKSATLNSSNGYKATWSGLTCGKQYTVSATAVLSSSANKEAWADAVLSATADPSRFTLQAKQDVYIKIKDSAPPKDCSINVEGTGDTGNGVFADIKLSGGENKTATLSESNKYVVTWSDLTCGKSYTVSVTKAGEKKSGAVTTTKVTATVNPSGSFSLPSGTKNVTVNLKKENNACDPSNTYTVQVTETQNEAEISQIENFLKSIGHNEYSGISIPASGPWYGARNPRLSRDGYGTIKGGDSVDIVFNKPTFEVNVPAGQGNYHYSSYVKSVTVNGKKQGSTSSYYKDKVCEDMNIVVEYSLKNTGVGTDLVDVVIQYFVDNVLKTTTDDKQAVSRGGTYSMTAPETYQNATFKNWQAIVNSNTNAGSGSSTSVSVKNVSGPLTIKLNYANAKQCKVTIQSATGGTTTPSGGTTKTVECGREAVQLDATPNSKYEFSKWEIKSGSGSFRGGASEASNEFYATTDATIAPVFESTVKEDNEISLIMVTKQPVDIIQLKVKSTHPLASPINLTYYAVGSATDTQDWSEEWNGVQPKTCTFNRNQTLVDGNPRGGGVSGTATLNAGESSWTFELYPSTACQIGALRSLMGTAYITFSTFSDSKYFYKRGTTSGSWTRTP